MNAANNFKALRRPLSRLSSIKLPGTPGIIQRVRTSESLFSSILDVIDKCRLLLINHLDEKFQNTKQKQSY